MNWIEISTQTGIALCVGGGLAFRTKEEIESKRWTESPLKIKLKKVLIGIVVITIVSFFFAAAKIGVTGNDKDWDLILGAKVFFVLSVSLLIGFLLAKKIS